VSALPAAIRPQVLGLGPGLGRWSIVLLATVFPYGRSAGLGAPLSAAATPRALVAASLLPLWHHYGRPSAPDAQLVLERFRSRPATDWLDTGSGPGWAER